MKNQLTSTVYSACRASALALAWLMGVSGTAFADIAPAETASENVAAIQAAIDAAAVASPAGTVTLGTGTFEINAQLMVTGGVTLVGQGWENTIIKQTTSGPTARCATVSDGAKLEGVTLTGGRLNATWKHGAGVDINDGTVSWCRITGNTNTTYNTYGGGVHINKGAIDHCIVDSNQAGTKTSGGGGIGTFSTFGPIVIDTCLVYGNTASISEGNYGDSGGGGLGFFQSTPVVTIRNTTIVGNATKGKGGGLRTVGTKILLENCIVAENEAGNDYEVSGSLKSDSSHNFIGGDPQFVDAENGDYRLGPRSLAIFAGAAREDNGVDLVGTAFASSPSMGCYEFTGTQMVNAPEFTYGTDATFSPSMAVLLTCPNDGATIYYTTDGTDPTDSSTPYNGSINISTTTTIKARAYKAGMTPSDIASATYALGAPTSPELGAVSVDPRATVATVSGEIVYIGNNLATSCDVYLALGPNYGSYGERTLIVSGATASFSYVIPNLDPERTYYYELTIVNNAQSQMSASTQGYFTTMARELLQPVAGDASATRIRIQEAIDGAVLEVPAGTVALAAGLFEIDTQLMVTGGVTLVGRGWDNTIIKQNAATPSDDTRVMTIDGGAKVMHLTLTGGRVLPSDNYRYGGGARIFDGTLSWCCVTNNQINTRNTMYGGGVCFVEGKGGQIDHCIVADNVVSTTGGTALGGGGIGIYKPFGTVIVDSCLVYNNRTFYSGTQVGKGAGIGIDFQQQGQDVVVRNTTIVGNTAGGQGATEASEGGAVFTTGDSKSKFSMVNCIVAYNTTMNTNTTMKLNYAGGVDYCFFDVADDVLGANSKTGDPMFRNPARGDYSLRGKSPCVDAGCMGEWITASSLALDGGPRILGRGPDMGCYETYNSGYVIRLR